MNQVFLIGRLTRDPELSYTPNTQKAVCRFTIAVDRPRRRDGGDSEADFIRITVWDRQAETCDRYLAKGRQVAIQGRIQTGSYKNREGVTVYTTDIVADRVEFLGGGQSQNGGSYQGSNSFQGGGSYQGGSSFQGRNSYQDGGSFQGDNSYQGGDSFQSDSYGSQQRDNGFNASQNTSFGAPQDAFDGPQESVLGDFDGLPDSFQAAEDDIPF